MQTGKILVNNMFARNNFERIGLYEGFWPETLDAWVLQGYPQESKGPGDNVSPIDPIDYFNFDLHKCGGFFDTEPNLGSYEVLEETEEWVISRNGAGAIFKWWKDRSGTPEHIDFDMKNREIWEEKYRDPLSSLDVRRFNGKWWEEKTLENDLIDFKKGEIAGRWNWYGHVGVWEVMRSSMGDLNMYQNLIMDPDWVHDFNRVYTDFFKRHYSFLFETNGFPDGVWVMDDLAYKNRLFASPKYLRELFLPYYIEIVDFFHDFDLPVIFHSDGDISEALPMLIEAGFEGLNPMEVKAGCDLLKFAKEYGDKLVFVGGMDVRVLETNNRDLVRKEALRLIEGMKALNCCFIFGSDHTIPPSVNYDTYRYLLDIYQENMMY